MTEYLTQIGTLGEGFEVDENGVITVGSGKVTSVIDYTNTPPTTPVSGNIYAVGSSPTGSWADHAYKIATYTTVWAFTDPKLNELVFVESSSIMYIWNGTTFVQTSSPVFTPQVTKLLFVDNGRTDSYTPVGSIDKPFLTIGAATAIATSGTTIKVIQGTYVEDVTLPGGVCLEGFGANSLTVTGNVVISSGANSSLRYMIINGNLTINANCILIDTYTAGAVTLTGTATVQAWNSHIISGTSDVTALTMSSSGKYQAALCTISSTGDAPAIAQSAGQVILNTATVVGSRAASPIINLTGGTFVGLNTQITNSAGGPALDVSSSGATTPNPNMIDGVIATGNVVCGSKSTVVGALVFIVTGALTGSSLTYKPASRITNDSSVTGDTVKDALETLASSSVLDIHGLTEESGIISTDELVFYDESATSNRKITLSDLNSALNLSYSPWTEVTAFTPTPASTSTITTTSDLSGTIKPGMPLQYTISGTTYYGVVTTITSNLITVGGISLSGDITALYYGNPDRMVQIDLLIPGRYEDATNFALFAADLGQSLVWKQGPAYIVGFSPRSRIVDGSSNGTTNLVKSQGHAGTAQAGAATSITLSLRASAIDDAYNDLYIAIVAGTGSGQIRQITDYVGGTKVATVATWTTNPDSTSEYKILLGDPSGSGGILTSPITLAYPKEWYDSGVLINSDMYALSLGSEIEVYSGAGTGKDAQDLSGVIVLVME